MSLYINFEPHSWYRGFAIQLDETESHSVNKWWGYTDDGNTYMVVKFTAHTLKELKQLIREYRGK